MIRRPPRSTRTGTLLPYTTLVRALGMTEGFDVGMEMSGSPDAFTSMLEHMNHGGKIAMLGSPAAQFGVDWGKIIFKGLQIKGIYGREMFETWRSEESRVGKECVRTCRYRG